MLVLHKHHANKQVRILFARVNVFFDCLSRDLTVDGHSAGSMGFLLSVNVGTILFEANSIYGLTLDTPEKSQHPTGCHITELALKWVKVEQTTWLRNPKIRSSHA